MNGVFIITGGTGGIGRACAELLPASATLLLCDVDEEKLAATKAELSQHSLQVETCVCDITNVTSVNQLVETAKQLGHVRAVIHTAGISPQMANAAKITDVNAIGTINITTAFLAVADEDFAIVNIASMGGYQLPSMMLPKHAYELARTDISRLAKKLNSRVRLLPAKTRPGAAYAISKNFVIWYSQAMAIDFGKKGARILSVSPGSIDTSMGQLEKAHGAGAMADVSALGRFGKPDEIAKVVLFCVSKNASYLTGTDILCDGGTIAAIKISGKKPKLSL